MVATIINRHILNIWWALSNIDLGSQAKNKINSIFDMEVKKKKIIGGLPPFPQSRIYGSAVGTAKSVLVLLNRQLEKWVWAGSQELK